MTRIGKGRAGRRLYRRPLSLVFLALAAGCVATAAVAAVGATSTTTASRGGSLSVLATPSSRTVKAGATARYFFKVADRPRAPKALAGRTALHLAGELPAGAAAVLTSTSTVASPAPGRRMSKLAITTTRGTPPGSYDLTLQAHRPGRIGHATVALVIAGPESAVSPSPLPAPTVPASVLRAPDAFTIAGNLTESLSPGAAQPLDLTLTNLESTDISISSLVVQVSVASAPSSDPTHPCGGEDFSVGQFSGPTGFTLAASGSASLSELGFAASEWPLVSMLNPQLNQDGCKRASLRLAFAGTATEVTP
jgi:hypothetical protein